MFTFDDPDATIQRPIAPHELARAVAALRAGQLVAFPTETVYGLGADAANESAVRRIFAAKGRPADHPVIVHLASAHMLNQWAATIPPMAERLAARFWPGPLTLIVPRAAHVLDVVTGGQSSVGLRVPDHPVAQALLQAFGGGIAAPSANRFGRISPTRAEHVRAELGDQVAIILDGGPTRVGVESTIIDVTGEQPTLLRPGQIPLAALEAALGQPLARRQPGSPRAPGTLLSHYAPRTPVEIVPAKDLVARVQALHKAEQRIAVLARQAESCGSPDVWWRVMPANADGYAHELYARLRELDALGADRIVVEAVPSDDDWIAVRDRLQRAAHGSTTHS